MNVKYFSIYLDFLSLFSALFYSFQCASLALILLNLYPSISFFSDIIINWIFSTSFSECSLCIKMQLIFVNLTSCNLAEFTSPNSVSVDYLVFLIYKIISSLNRDSFASSFLIWMSAIYFFISPNCPCYNFQYNNK